MMSRRGGRNSKRGKVAAGAESLSGGAAVGSGKTPAGAAGALLSGTGGLVPPPGALSLTPPASASVPGGRGAEAGLPPVVSASGAVFGAITGTGKSAAQLEQRTPSTPVGGRGSRGGRDPRRGRGGSSSSSSKGAANSAAAAQPVHAASAASAVVPVAQTPGGRIVTLDDVRRDQEVQQLIEWADHYLEAIGYTDHGIKHVERVAGRARRILLELGCPEREAELAAIAGLTHDIGNIVHRVDHAQTSAVMAYPILRRLGMPIPEAAVILGAIGNHDEGTGEPVSNVSAALILADKSDVLRSRVRKSFDVKDIHDRVNYAATHSRLVIDRGRHLITLMLAIDTQVSPVMDYFEIFLSRMKMCKRAAHFLKCQFSLVINETTLL